MKARKIKRAPVAKRKLERKKEKTEKKDEEMEEIDDGEEIEDMEEEDDEETKDLTETQKEEYKKRFELGPKEGTRKGEIEQKFVEYILNNLVDPKDDDQAVEWFKWLMCNGQVLYKYIN